MNLSMGASLLAVAKYIYYNKCPENSRSRIVFRTGIFRKLTLCASAMTNKYQHLIKDESQTDQQG